MKRLFEPGLLSLGLDLVLLRRVRLSADPPLGLLEGFAGKVLLFSAVFEPKGSWLGSVVLHLCRDLGTHTPVSAGEACVGSYVVLKEV